MMNMPSPGSENDMNSTADSITQFNIPPRPAYLMAIHRELRRETPDFRKIGQLLRRDAGIAGSLLKRVNSPYYGLSQPVNTLEAAIVIVGTDQIDTLVTLLVIRNMLGGNKTLPRFWDITEKRSLGMSYLAIQTHQFSQPFANSFGLFCDIGIALLKEKQPDYSQTLKIANQSTENFVAIETARHGLNHAQIGAELAQSWGVADRVITAIHLHHQPDVLLNERYSLTARRMLAANHIVDCAIDAYRNKQGYQDIYSEWEENRVAVMELLDVTEEKILIWRTALEELFEQA